MITDYKKLALEQQGYVVKIRRELHKNPETRFMTPLTSSLILDEINSFIKSNSSHAKISAPRESRGGITVDVDIPDAMTGFYSEQTLMHFLSGKIQSLTTLQ